METKHFNQELIAFLAISTAEFEKFDSSLEIAAGGAGLALADFNEDDIEELFT